MAVEAEYVVEEKRSRRSRKYPRIVEAKEVDEVFYIPFTIHVIKKMLVEERPDRKNGFWPGALDELVHYEPYYIKDKLSGKDAIQVFIEFWNWKWKEETLTPLFVPADWSDEKVLEFVHKLWELGRWMANADLVSLVKKKANGKKQKYPRVEGSTEVDGKVTIERCRECKPFEIHVTKYMLVKVRRGPRNGFWRDDSWVKVLRELMYFEPYYLKDKIDGPLSGATQVEVVFDWHPFLEEPLPFIYTPEEWDEETVAEFVRRLQELSKWIASA